MWIARLALATTLLTASISNALAWGEDGHSIVAEIAQRPLTREATDAIAGILNPQQNRPA
jgi:hypothetical protein